MRDEPHKIYGTCLALGEEAVLIRGPSGSGKSDIAYRCINYANTSIPDCKLVADDQVIITKSNNNLYACPPKNIEGKIEVRGIGIINLPYITKAKLKIVIDLVGTQDIPRVQIPFEEENMIELLGIRLPNLKLSAFEPSSHLKLLYALQQK